MSRADDVHDEAARKPGEDSNHRVLERVLRHQRRLERARAEGGAGIWRVVARIGVLGWLIVLPPVLGVVLGRLLDRRLGTSPSGALGLLLVGLLAGGVSGWLAVREQGGGAP